MNLWCGDKATKQTTTTPLRKAVVLCVLISVAGLFAGCAATTPLSLLYSPSTGARGGAGKLLLVAAGVNKAFSDSTNTRWVIGKRMDSDGKITGDILSTRPAEGIVRDALQQELTMAGYRVDDGSSMPSGVSKGVELTTMQIELTETSGIPKVEAACAVKVTMDLWKDGAKIKKLSYESKVSDVAVVDRDLLQKKVLEKGLRAVMDRAVPEIVAGLEKKP